jgi:hypothetical protein
VDIREKLISRKEAMAWLETHESLFPYIYGGVLTADILKNIGLSEDRFWELVEGFRVSH